MARLAHLVGQHAREIGECMRRGATPASRVRLMRDTVRFHLRNRLQGGPRPGEPNGYEVTMASRSVRLFLRPHAGDFFVFHEIFVDRPYDMPASWRAGVRAIVDLGAHVGLTSLFFLEEMPQAHVVCVEAAPDNAALLRRNLAGFADRTTILEAAVLGRLGTARFPVAGHSWGRSVQVEEIPAAPDGAGRSQTIEVPTLTVSEVMRRAGLDRIDLLKVDVEGAEALIFESPAPWLDAVGMIVIELHEPYTLAAFTDAVGRAGFRTLDPGHGHGNRMPMALSPAWAGRAGTAI